MTTNEHIPIEGRSAASPDLPIVVDGQIAPAHIRRLTIQGFRGIRDLRLVQGSALDRLLSDKGLRSRMGSELIKSKVRDQLKPESQDALAVLDATFRKEGLPGGIDLAITGGQGWSVAAMIGLTGQRDGIDLPLPLTSWGAGTRRLAALAIAGHDQGDAPIVLVDEVERGLEPYRQRLLVEKLQTSRTQVFLTTHSTAALAAASRAAVWYVDHQGNISRLESETIDRHRRSDPETFLSRLAIIAEGKTERGFVRALLERALGAPLEQHGSGADRIVGAIRSGVRYGDAGYAAMTCRQITAGFDRQGIGIANWRL